MYEEIKKLIKQKNNDIDDIRLKYFTNYFYVLCKNNLIPQNIKLDDLINNALTYANKIEFYDENHWVYKKYGGEVKGFCDPKTRTIYVRNNLEDSLKEMLIYHELHHAVQTNPKNDQVGINQISNIGRLIMEAQTQFMAEKVYCEINNIVYEDRQIPSENLRMLPGNTIVSKLHNYEMYDNLLSKLAIILDVPKEYFIYINFLYENDRGLKDLEERYNNAKEKYKFPWKFENLLYNLDYIYCVDLCTYAENPDKQVILSGKKTENLYEIHSGKQGLQLSLKIQQVILGMFDEAYLLALINNNGNYQEFAYFVVDNEKRQALLSEMKQPINNFKRLPFIK